MKKKKGFTLVELLVVIAILAVLATVSVVGYMGFTKKAQVSNDTSLVSQLNTLLKADEAVDGKAKTPTDALKVTEESGYDVTKLTPTTDKYNIVWNQEENQFALLDESDNVVHGTISSNNYMNWKFVDTYTEGSSFSTYLKGEATIETITTSNGLDVGNNTVSTINYVGETTGKDNVVIRTNGGTLVINASEDTVNHYGAADYVNVKAIKGDSYHEFGSAVYARVESGHYVAEKDSTVLNLNVANSAVTITEENGANVVSYSKSSNDVTVTINGITKEISDVKTEDEINEAVKNSDVVTEGGVAEVNGIQFKSLQNAIESANDGAKIIVLNDIDVDKMIVLNEENKKITLDLNGKKLYNTNDIWDDSTQSWSVISIEAGHLTITGNGAILAKDNDCYAVMLSGKTAKCTIEDGIFKGNIHAVYVQGGELYINGGSYSISQKYPDASKADEFVLNCYDQSCVEGTAKIYVKGGTFDNFNPSDCYAEGVHTNFCVDGYGVAKDANGNYIYTEKDVSGTNHKFYTVVKL